MTNLTLAGAVVACIVSAAIGGICGCLATILYFLRKNAVKFGVR